MHIVEKKKEHNCKPHLLLYYHHTATDKTKTTEKEKQLT
jgi:hypothetical protein